MINDNIIKMKSIKSLIEDSTKVFFINEDVTESAWRGLSLSEKKEQTAMALIAEYTSFLKEDAETSVKDAAAGVKSEFQPSSSLSVAYFNKILASNGNIAKCPNYASNITLISYARDLTQGKPSTKGGALFLAKLMVLDQAIHQLTKYANSFEKAILAEAKNESNEKNRIISEYFLSLVVAIDVGVDTLYSSCIKADIDYNNKPAIVKTVKFECNDSTFLEEHFTVLHYFNSLAISGKLTGILDTGKLEQLQDAKDKVLKEKVNILDVAFSLLTTNKYTDLLFLPLYGIRYVVYMAKFLTSAYARINFSIDKSIEMIKKNKVTEEEFVSYSSQATKKAMAVDQASKKAAINVSEDIRTSKNAINDYKGNTSEGNNTSSVML